MQSLKESVVWLQSHLNFQKFKEVLNPINGLLTQSKPTPQNFFENFAKRGILSEFDNKTEIEVIPSSFLSYKSLKLKLRGF